MVMMMMNARRFAAVLIWPPFLSHCRAVPYYADRRPPAYSSDSFPSVSKPVVVALHFLLDIAPDW